MKKGRLTFLIILLFALFAGITWGANRQLDGRRQPDFTMFSSTEYGVSLLYDTLRHMRYPMGVLYRPVGETVSINDVVFIIQPTNPRPNDAMAADILSWVRRGGRLIYLENSQPTIIDRVLSGEYYVPFGTFRWYRVGMGEVITGRANAVVNSSLMYNSGYGEGLAYVLSAWGPDRIYFAEYYHGFHRSQAAIRQMPVWLQLVALQIVIAALAAAWHVGKRFGWPIPLYEEVEREENEQVLTLARLYKQADKKLTTIDKINRRH